MTTRNLANSVDEKKTDIMIVNCIVLWLSVHTEL